MTLDKQLEKLVEDTGVSQERIVQLIMAEQARDAGIPYSHVVNHEKYGRQLEIFSGKSHGHRPFSLSVNKAVSVLYLIESIRDFVEKYNTVEEKTKTILRKAKNK